MATPRPAAPIRRPLVTRKTTLGFTAVSVVASLLEAYLLAAINDQTGPGAALLALCVSTAAITSLVAWIEGFVLAMRSTRLLWMLVACLPPPLGPLLCGLWAPDPPREDAA